MEFAELIKLVGVVIVILGFALKLDSILIIFLALISTGLVGGLGIDGPPGVDRHKLYCQPLHGHLYHDLPCNRRA